MAEEFRVLRPYEFHCQLMSKGARADGRKLNEFRNFKLETDGIRTANSSSLVKLGNTSLVCGCTTRLHPAGIRNQQDNEINIKIELPPICSSPTGHRTQHSPQILTKILKNIIDDTNCLDKFCLNVADSEHYWTVDIEVVCLNYDGCLIDAALTGVIAALKTLKLKDERKLVPEKHFVINTIPVCSSFAMIGDYIICDPNLEEETIAQSTFAITIDTYAKSGKFHVNKVGGKAINFGKLNECITLAEERAEKIVRYLKEIGFEKDTSDMDCS